MPTPTSTITIGAKSSTLNAGSYIIFRNLTRGGKVTARCNSSGEAIPDDIPNTWVNGDKVSIEVRGKYNSSTVKTITKGGIDCDLGTLSEDTNTVAVDL